MAHDAFPRYRDITEANFLVPRLESLSATVPYQSFKDGIAALERLRKPLKVLQVSGRLAEVSYWPQYMRAIQWLNGESPLTDWISVPQIDDYRTIDDPTASNFNGYVSNLNNLLSSQGPFQQAQLYIGAVETKLVDELIREQVDPLQSSFNDSLLEGLRNLIESLNLLQQERESNLNSSFNAQTESLRVEKENAIAEFTEARALANWSDFYGERVREYEKLLYGKQWPVDGAKNKYRSYLTYRRTVPKRAFLSIDVSTLKGLSIGAWRCLLKALAVWRAKVFSYSGRRTIWFGALVLGVVGIVLINVASIYNVHSVLGIDPAKLRPIHGDTQLLAKISSYAALLAIPAVGYSFSNKNYRIYANILEQYRHREIVAKTIQGILKNSQDSDTDVRKELANVAATAMFEQKTIGHLTKNEANSASILDVFRAIRP